MRRLTSIAILCLAFNASAKHSQPDKPLVLFWLTKGTDPVLQEMVARSISAAGKQARDITLQYRAYVGWNGVNEHETPNLSWVDAQDRDEFVGGLADCEERRNRNTPVQGDFQMGSPVFSNCDRGVINTLWQRFLDRQGATGYLEVEKFGVGNPPLSPDADKPIFFYPRWYEAKDKSGRALKVSWTEKMNLSQWQAALSDFIEGGGEPGQSMISLPMPPRLTALERLSSEGTYAKLPGLPLPADCKTIYQLQIGNGGNPHWSPFARTLTYRSIETLSNEKKLPNPPKLGAIVCSLTFIASEGDRPTRIHVKCPWITTGEFETELRGSLDDPKVMEQTTADLLNQVVKWSCPQNIPNSKPVARPAAPKVTIPETKQGVCGHVLDEKGQPVSGAQVELNPVGRHIVDIDFGPGASPEEIAKYSYTPPRATTDVEGNYCTGNIGEAKYNIIAYGTDLVTSAEQKVEVQKDQVAKAELVAPRAVAITGKVVDAQGLPVAKAFLYALNGYENRHTNRPDGNEPENHGSGYADEQGNFQLLGLTPGEIRLKISPHNTNVHSGGLAWDPGEVELTAKAPSEGVVLRLSEDSFKGRLVDAKGKPKAKAQVALYAAGKASSTSFSKSIAETIRTDELGDFVFGALPAGNYDLQAEDAQHHLQVFHLSHPSKGVVQFAFPAVGELSGRVINKSSIPLGKLKVRAQRVEKVANKYEPVTGEVSPTTDLESDGTFALMDLQPGRYRLSVVGRMDSPFVDADVGASNVNVVLPPLGAAK